MVCLQAAGRGECIWMWRMSVDIYLQIDKKEWFSRLVFGLGADIPSP
jgi:hypothetical protein